MGRRRDDIATTGKAGEHGGFPQYHYKWRASLLAAAAGILVLLFFAGWKHWSRPVGGESSIRDRDAVLVSTAGADILVPRATWDRLGEKARKDIARHIESEIEAARTAVARLLGLDPPRGVVVDTSLANLPEIATRLRRYPWRLTWPVANSRVGGDSVADRTAVGLIRNEGEGVQWPERSILRHEVAHALAKIGSSEGAETGSEGGYGTDLPDWLDELPAIFAEDEDLSNRRRVLWHSFCKRYGRLPFPLLRFFAMEHPLWSDQKFREAVRLQNGSKVAKVRGTRTIVLSRSRFQVLSQEAAMYYAQVRGVIDFLVDEDSLAVVALLMKKGSRGELKDPAVVSEIFRTRGVDLTEDRLLAYCVGIE